MFRKKITDFVSVLFFAFFLVLNLNIFFLIPQFKITSRKRWAVFPVGPTPATLAEVKLHRLQVRPPGGVFEKQAAAPCRELNRQRPVQLSSSSFVATIFLNYRSEAI